MTHLVDTHAHLHDEKFKEETEVIFNRAIENNVSLIINVGTSIENSREAIKLAEKYAQCYALVGIHPHDSSDFTQGSIGELEEMLTHPKVLGIGEIGLDYHYDFSPKDKQMIAFIEQWKLAARKQVPVVLHIREAYDDFFANIKGLPESDKRLLHCFSGDLDIARKALDMGFNFSIGGTLTFKKADIIRNVFKYLPIDKIHLETDCPYLAPTPKRGKRNEPSYIRYTFNSLAELRKMNSDELAAQLFNNAIKFFGI